MMDRGLQALRGYNARKTSSAWRADSGATWNLNSNGYGRRLDQADDAGLPIMPGLVRHDEVVAGAILHAIRFTASATQRARRPGESPRAPELRACRRWACGSA